MCVTITVQLQIDLHKTLHIVKQKIYLQISGQKCCKEILHDLMLMVYSYYQSKGAYFALQISRIQ